MKGPDIDAYSELLKARDVYVAFGGCECGKVICKTDKTFPLEGK
jgi:hypothetical protein